MEWYLLTLLLWYWIYFWTYKQKCIKDICIKDEGFEKINKPEPEKENEDFPVYAIVLVSVGSVLILLILIIIIIKCCSKNKIDSESIENLFESINFD